MCIHPTNKLLLTKTLRANHALKIAATVIVMVLPLSATAALTSPSGLAVDPNTKTLYIADSGVAGKVVKYNPQQKTTADFVTVNTPVSVAVNNNGEVYVGVVGLNQRIEVYNSKAASINTLSTPPESSPLNLAIDANNTVFMTKGITGNSKQKPQVYPYNNDNSFNYAASGVRSHFDSNIPLGIAPNTHYSLTVDNGKLYIIADQGNTGSMNIFDIPLIVANQIPTFINQLGLLPSTDPIRLYTSTHVVQATQSSSSIADASHNIIYTNADTLVIRTVSIQSPNKVLLNNLPSAPAGIAYDSSRARIYVAFPQEHLVRGYTVNYTTQNGVKTPSSLTPAVTIR